MSEIGRKKLNMNADDALLCCMLVRYQLTIVANLQILAPKNHQNKKIVHDDDVVWIKILPSFISLKQRIIRASFESNQNN